mmetsp:Transcript_29867/g.45177  ORF Transcript_29867/g.45177 Transcript_29867/m.45177 type:complete len:84 (-) Transcript_29867:84-335(-)
MGIVGGRFLLLLEVVIRVEMDEKSSSAAVAVAAVRRLGLGGGGHEKANNNNCWVEDGCGCLGVKRWAAVDDIMLCWWNSSLLI